ncbi:MAG: thioredoxin peroxidase [Treponema sp.]|nr:MAG: thioredoxin peroxidase [Treponema sp.]
MMQLHQDIQKFEAKKIRRVVICPDKLDSIKKFTEKNTLSFDLIVDSDHLLADKYGQEVKVLKLGRMPSQLLLDKQENLIFKHYANSMSDIVDNAVILSKV